MLSGPVQVHIHEGAFNVQILDGTYSSENPSGSFELFSILTRHYDTVIKGNRIHLGRQQVPIDGLRPVVVARPGEQLPFLSVETVQRPFPAAEVGQSPHRPNDPVWSES